MSVAPLSADEEARLAVLREYAILDTAAEQRFEDIVEIARYVCNAPIAAISFVDERRQWLKAQIGMGLTETPRDVAFCAHAILGDRTFVVDDACADPRFRDNPLVLAAPQIRFYAGAPLIVHGGHRLGTLCALDTRARSLDDKPRDILERLARSVVTLLEARRTNARLARALESVRTLGELIPICASCHEVRDDQDYWSSLERFVASRTGSRFTHGICPTCARETFPELATELFGDGDGDGDGLT